MDQIKHHNTGIHSFFIICLSVVLLFNAFKSMIVYFPLPGLISDIFIGLFVKVLSKNQIRIFAMIEGVGILFMVLPAVLIITFDFMIVLLCAISIFVTGFLISLAFIYGSHYIISKNKTLTNFQKMIGVS